MSVYIAASLLCALSPTIEVLIAARLAQGMAGAVGIVVSQAAGRDVHTGAELIRCCGRSTVLAGLAGLAAIAGPLIGGQLARVTDWRGVFAFLAVLGVAILLAILISGSTDAALFAYLCGATCVLQDDYGLSPQGYSLAFGATSLSFVVCGSTAGRLAERWSQSGTLVLGLAMVATGSLRVLASALGQLPLAAVMAASIVVVGGARFTFGALAAPVVGVLGTGGAVPLGAVTTASAALAVMAPLILVYRRQRAEPRSVPGVPDAGTLNTAGDRCYPCEPRADRQERTCQAPVTIRRTGPGAGRPAAGRARRRAGSARGCRPGWPPPPAAPRAAPAGPCRRPRC